VSHDDGRTSHAGLLGISLGAFVVLGLPDGMLGAAWPFLRASFGQPLAALGIIQLAVTVGYLLASGFSGTFTRTLGRGTVLVIAATAGSVGALGMAATPWWWAVVAAAAVLGAAGGTVDAAINAFQAVGDSTRRLNLVHACYGVGATVGPILLTRLVVAGAGWSTAYGVLCGCEVVMVVAFVASRARWMRPGEPARARASAGDGPPGRDGPGNEGPGRRRRSTGIARRPVALSLGTFFVYTGVEVAAGQWSFTVFTASRRFDTAVAGALVAGYWGSLTLGRFLAAGIATRAGPGVLLRASVVGAVGGAGLFWWRPTESVGAAGLMVLGLSLAAVFPTLVGQTPGWSGDTHAPTVIGWQLASAGAGGALLSALAGVLMQSAGLEVLGPFLLATTVLLAVCELAGRRLGMVDLGLVRARP